MSTGFHFVRYNGFSGAWALQHRRLRPVSVILSCLQRKNDQCNPPKATLQFADKDKSSRCEPSSRPSPAGILRAQSVAAVGGWTEQSADPALDLSIRAALQGNFRGISAPDVALCCVRPASVAAAKAEAIRSACGAATAMRLHAFAATSGYNHPLRTRLALLFAISREALLALAWALWLLAAPLVFLWRLTLAGSSSFMLALVYLVPIVADAATRAARATMAAAASQPEQRGSKLLLAAVSAVPLAMLHTGLVPARLLGVLLV